MQAIDVKNYDAEVDEQVNEYRLKLINELKERDNKERLKLQFGIEILNELIIDCNNDDKSEVEYVVEDAN